MYPSLTHEEALTHPYGDFQFLYFCQYEAGKYRTISEPKYLEEDFVPLVNHSCDANTWVDNGYMKWTANRDIEAGEEITHDYRSFFHNVYSIGTCQCGAVDCAGFIGDGSCFDPNFVRKVYPHCVKYIKELIEEKYGKELERLPSIMYLE